MSVPELLRAARNALFFQSELAGNLVPLPLNQPSSSAEDTLQEESITTPRNGGDDTTVAGINVLIPEGHPVRSIDSIEGLHVWVSATPLVPIDEERMNPVLGVGDPNADLMIVGEAPGAEEDKRGEPFVGRAGKLLDKILAAINFDRTNVYITNILKSRPPNNRDPLPEEVDAHIPILYRQIELIQPKLILCVGKQAACGLLGQQTSLGALRGRFHDFHGIPLLATYHPAYLLRSPQMKRVTWEDVQLLRERYDAITAASPA